MTRAYLILNTSDDRKRAMHWIAQGPDGMRVEFKKPVRSLDQNSLMWALLTEVSQQLRWHGNRLPPDQWKLVFLSGLRKELRVIPNFTGDGFIPIGYSSSDLSREEMSGLIELIYAYGAEHGVTFRTKEDAA